MSWLLLAENKWWQFSFDPTIIYKKPQKQNLPYKGLQRDVVYLCWPIATSYTSRNAGGWGGGGGCGVSANEYRCAHHVTWSPNKLSTSIINLPMLPYKEVKGADLEFIIESVHFIQADSHVGFYALFILWCCWLTDSLWRAPVEGDDGAALPPLLPLLL